MKNRDLCEHLLKLDPELEVRFPWPSPPGMRERTTTRMDPAFLNVRKIDGKRTLVIGNTIQEREPNLNLEYMLRDRVVADFREGRLGESLLMENAKRVDRFVGAGAKHIAVFRKLREDTDGQPYLVFKDRDGDGKTTHAFVLIEETATPGGMSAALRCSGHLEELLGTPTAAALACMNAPESLPDLPVRIHRILNPRTKCLRCHHTFQTRRAAEIHQALESGQSETIGAGLELWKGYQEDLQTLLEEVRRQIHQPDQRACPDCGTPYHCQVCCAAGAR